MDAFDAFFQREYVRVHRSLVTALGDVSAADEAAQEAFVKAWLRWGRVQHMDRAAAWVYVVAVRDALRPGEHDSQPPNPRCYFGYLFVAVDATTGRSLSTGSNAGGEGDRSYFPVTVPYGPLSLAR